MGLQSHLASGGLAPEPCSRRPRGPAVLCARLIRGGARRRLARRCLLVGLVVTPCVSLQPDAGSPLLALG